MNIKKIISSLICCTVIIMSAFSSFYAKAAYNCDYIYNRLSAEEAEFYDALLEACTSVDENDRTYEYTPNAKYSSELTEERVGEISLIFYLDHPEFFWISLETKYSKIFGSTYFSYKILPSFRNGSTRQKAKSDIKAAAQVYLNGASKYSNDFERAKYLQDELLENVSYKINDWDQSIASVFLLGYTVCAGYSKAYEYLCNSMGIDSIVITSCSHAWNAVRIGGHWYLVDVTNDGSSDKFFLISDQRMSEIDETLNERYRVTGTLNGVETTKTVLLHDIDIFSYIEHYDDFPKCAYTFGDANGDDQRTVSDAAYIARMLASGKRSELDFRADFNLDNKIDVCDAAAIARVLAKRKK